jgi:Leucine-rich repeat (LRR) protein
MSSITEFKTMMQQRTSPIDSQKKTTSTIDEAIQSASKAGLKALDLSSFGNSVKSSDLEKLKHIPHLDKLVVHSRFIRDSDITHLHIHPELKELHLRDCWSITGLGLHIFKNLRVLNLINSSIANAQVAELATLTQLVELTFFCFNVNDDGFAPLKALTKLEKLTLKFTDKLTDAGVCHFKELSELRELHLDPCSELTNTSAVSLSTLTKLQKLSLVACSQIDDEGIAHFKKLKELELCLK